MSIRPTSSLHRCLPFSDRGVLEGDHVRVLDYERLGNVAGRYHKKDACTRSPPVEESSKSAQPALELTVEHPNRKVHHERVGGERFVAFESTDESGVDQIHEEAVIG